MLCGFRPGSFPRKNVTPCPDPGRDPRRPAPSDAKRHVKTAFKATLRNIRVKLKVAFQYIPKLGENTPSMSNVFFLLFALSMLACGDSGHQSENPSSNPLYSSSPEQLQQGQIVPVEGFSLLGVEVVIIDAGRLVVLARASVDSQGGFAVSVPQRPRSGLGVSGPYMATYVDTAFVFTGEPITVAEASGRPAGKIAENGADPLLGDVDRDQSVNGSDALILFYYLLNGAFLQGDNILLGDVNSDGQTDWADLALLGRFLTDDQDGANPLGIGEPVLSASRPPAGAAADSTMSQPGADVSNTSLPPEGTAATDSTALVAFHQSMGSTDAARRMQRNGRWLSENPLYLWSGLRVDASGRVTALWSSGRRGDVYGGVLVPELAQLTYLEELTLDGIGLTGPLLPELAQLTFLKMLNLGSAIHVDNGDLMRNHLTGPIPATWGQLTHLETLILSNNQLTGPIPPELSQLTNLVELDLSNNQLTGPIPPELSQLTNLVELDLSNNQLTGPIPAGLEVHFDQLALNDLFDIVPRGERTSFTAWGTKASLAKWAGVKVNASGRVVSLRFPDANVTGPIPPQIGDLTELRLLDMRISSRQSLNQIPTAIGRLAKLETLIVRHVEGPLPAELGDLSSLKHLDIDMSFYAGPLPERLGNLSELEYLKVAGPPLTGRLPASLGNLSKLTVLDLRTHHFTGPIPESFGNLTNIKILYLGGSPFLSGPLPASLGRLKKLEQLSIGDLDSDIHRGERDKSYEEGTRLGSLPPEWAGMESLKGLGLHSVTGSLPPEWGFLKNLSLLQLTGWLEGPLPSEWSGMTSLCTLWLPTNELSGPLPKSWVRLSALRNVRLEYNALSGPLPPEWGDMLSLQKLNLSHNPIASRLPPEWGRMQALEELLCPSCQLTGPIPNEWKSMQTMHRLDLRKNELDGPMPQWFDQWSGLEWLGLSGNPIWGNFPNFTKEVKFYVDAEHLTGCIPRVLARQYAEIVGCGVEVRIEDLRACGGPVYGTSLCP